MQNDSLLLLKTKCGDAGSKKLADLNNGAVNEILVKYIKCCNPGKVFICTDTPEDIDYIRDRAIKNGEEKCLKTEGHTIHFDGYNDQARDRKNTKYFFSPGANTEENINSISRKEGYRDVNELLTNIMQHKEMYVRFLCLGPVNSVFSISCLQITDSAYVAHSESILFRNGYEEFKKIGNSDNFFKFIHSAGELENGVSKNVEKRRIAVDLEENIIFSINTQYAGNTVGLKKLALRLTIKKASREGWLAEHMFLMGIRGPNNRVTYFSGAFPSACGKTSTAMLEDETIMGDDISYIRSRNETAFAVNAEQGIFGIITDVNSKDAPLINEVLNQPGEIIFSNVLVDENNIPYWIGKDGKMPEKGINHSGEWFQGKKDAQGKDIPPAHKNSRYTLRLSQLKNVDKNLNNPEGVELSGIVYGGRDSDTSVPVEQAFDWAHGILTKGASLESETTSATLGKEGVREFNPMSNMDFLSISPGLYIKINLDFGSKLKKPPQIFSVNYFLKDKEGKHLNTINDKHIWFKWMELRIHGEAGAIKTPTGFIPEYKDLKDLFKRVLNKEYGVEEYAKQFMLKVPENIAKIERIVNIYKAKIEDAPKAIFKVLEEQKHRIEEARKKFGDYIAPDKW